MGFNNGLQIDKLVEGQVAGPKTINPIIDWIRNLHTISDFLNMSVNGLGSSDIDFDFPRVAGKILAMMERIQGEFKATITGTDRLEVAGGHVLMPDNAYSIGGSTRSLRSSDNGNVLSVNLTAQGGISWAWSGSVPSASVSGTTLHLPVCQPYKSGNKWMVRQLHLGSFVFAFPPAPFIADFDATQAQSLDQVGGTLVWRTYKTCNSGGGQ